MKTFALVGIGIVGVALLGLAFLMYKKRTAPAAPAPQTPPATVNKDSILQAANGYKSSIEQNASPADVPAWHSEAGKPRRKVDKPTFERFVAATAASLAGNKEWQEQILTRAKSSGYNESGLAPNAAFYVAARDWTAAEYFY